MMPRRRKGALAQAMIMGLSSTLVASHSQWSISTSSMSQPGMAAKSHSLWTCLPGADMRCSHIHTHIYAHKHAHILTTYIHIHICAHIHTHIHTYTHTYIHTHARMHARTHTYIHVHTWLCFTVCAAENVPNCLLNHSSSA